MNDKTRMDDVYSGLAKSLGKPDWHYRDLPWMRLEYWNHLMVVFGDEDVMFIAGSKKQFEDGFFVRGQILVSPGGMENLTAHLQQIKTRKDCPVCNGSD